MSEENMLSVFLFLLGTIFGSFLNVCIARLPHEKSIISPGSHCSECKTPVAWYDNVPLISYWVLLGKCRQCGYRFSMQYFWVELLTGIVFVLFYKYFGLTPELIAYLFMACCFIVTVFVDFYYRIIPDEISIGGMLFGVLFSFFIPSLHGVEASTDIGWMAHLYSLGWSLVGLLAGGGSIYMSGVLGDKLLRTLRLLGVACRKRPKLRAFFKRYRGLSESMGGGDVKLMALVGAFLGWKLAFLTFFLAPFYGAVFGIIQKLRTDDPYMPYGPFLVCGALTSLFFGNEIIHLVLMTYRI